MATLDKNAIRAAMTSVVETLGLVTKAEAKTSGDSAAKRAARIEEYQKVLREGGFVRTSGAGKGKFRTIGAPIALEFALKLIRLGGDLPSEYVAKANWANAVTTLEALADAAGIDRKVMLNAFGIKPATEAAPAAQVVGEVAGMQVIERINEVVDAKLATVPATEPANVVPMNRKARRNAKKTA